MTAFPPPPAEAKCGVRAGRGPRDRSLIRHALGFRKKRRLRAPETTWIEPRAASPCPGCPKSQLLAPADELWVKPVDATRPAEYVRPYVQRQANAVEAVHSAGDAAPNEFHTRRASSSPEASTSGTDRQAGPSFKAPPLASANPQRRLSARDGSGAKRMEQARDHGARRPLCRHPLNDVPTTEFANLGEPRGQSSGERRVCSRTIHPMAAAHQWDLSSSRLCGDSAYWEPRSRQSTHDSDASPSGKWSCF
jgi:hypothetical protein